MKIKSILVAGSLVAAPLAASAAELDLKTVSQYYRADTIRLEKMKLNHEKTVLITPWNHDHIGAKKSHIKYND